MASEDLSQGDPQKAASPWTAERQVASADNEDRSADLGEGDRQAIGAEHDYTIRWVDAEVHLSEFRDIFDDAFRESYQPAGVTLMAQLPLGQSHFERQYKTSLPISIPNSQVGPLIITRDIFLFQLLEDAIKAKQNMATVCADRGQQSVNCHSATLLTVYKEIAFLASLEMNEPVTRTARRQALVSQEWDRLLKITPHGVPTRRPTVEVDGFAKAVFWAWWEREFDRIISARRVEVSVEAGDLEAVFYKQLSDAVTELRAVIRPVVTRPGVTRREVQTMRAGNLRLEMRVAALLIMYKARYAAVGVAMRGW
jgi:hypothetical protein